VHGRRARVEQTEQNYKSSGRVLQLDQLRNHGNPSETDDDETLPVMRTDAAPPR
jgi:hypothetical protein